MTENTRRTEVQHLVIDAHADGQRLDNFLLKQFKALPKSHWYNLLRKGQIRVNGGRVKPHRKLLLGDKVRIPPLYLPIESDDAPAAPPPHWVKRLREAIVYQDEGLVVLNKPAGLASHGGSGIDWGAIELMRVVLDNPNLQLAHRLDRPTSGLLLFAKTREALSAIHEALREQRSGKYYLALLAGQAKQSSWQMNTQMSDQRGDTPDREQQAVSHFKVLSVKDGATLVEVSIETGRMHQIRRHAQASGLAIVGDDQYGDRETNKRFARQGHKGLFLHAHRFRLNWQGQARWFTVEPDSQRYGAWLSEAGLA